MVDKNLESYRATLIDTLRLLNEAYDKMLVTLSGGALGLSIIFLKDVLAVEAIKHPRLLVSAWILFILSLSGVLGRLLFGIVAYRKAIRQVDDGSIRGSRVGGSYSIISRTLHIAAALTLSGGPICTGTFAYLNVGE